MQILPFAAMFAPPGGVSPDEKLRGYGADQDTLLRKRVPNNPVGLLKGFLSIPYQR